jgi:hypothetical protein
MNLSGLCEHCEFWSADIDVLPFPSAAAWREAWKHRTHCPLRCHCAVRACRSATLNDKTGRIERNVSIRRLAMFKGGSINAAADYINIDSKPECGPGFPIGKRSRDSA